MEAVNRFVILLFTVFAFAWATAESENFLNTAILELPPKYFGDVPLNERPKMLLQMSDTTDPRLDYCNGWLHWHSDSENSLHGTSMIFLKLLPRKNDNPLVFVHMPKPFAGVDAPQKNQTFVLERVNQTWRDITSSIIPKQVDLTIHFRPRRAVTAIEVGPYEKRERNDHPGFYYDFGKRQLDLVWNGSSFEIRQARGSEFSDDD